MADTKTAPCWVLTNDDGSSEEHFPTEERAAEFATRCLEGTWAPQRLDHVCVVAACEGCGYVYDEEGDGFVHFADMAEAEKLLTDGEGWARTPEGWLCQPCNVGECDCADFGVQHATQAVNGGEVFAR